MDRVVIDREISGTSHEQKAFGARWKAGRFDVFISHASADKAGLARPLSRKLREMGYIVWLDESEIEAGAELVKSLDDGIRQSRCGLIVLSKAFIGRKWTQYEVEQLLRLSQEAGKKLLFLWHGVNEDEIREWSLVLADRVAFQTDRYSIDELVLELARAIR